MSADYYAAVLLLGRTFPEIQVYDVQQIDSEHLMAALVIDPTPLAVAAAIEAFRCGDARYNGWGSGGWDNGSAEYLVAAVEEHGYRFSPEQLTKWGMRLVETPGGKLRLKKQDKDMYITDSYCGW